MTMRVVNYRTRREFENDRNELFHFVAEKSKTATSPLVINRLCKEYIEENGTPRRMTSLRQTVYLLRDRIQNMEEFDKDTKVKIMIALGTQVDKEYLEELHRDADIRVDKQGRILEYKLKDVDLHLNADHITQNKDKLGNENQKSCTTVETAEKNDTTLNKTAIKRHVEENSFVNEEKGSPALKKRRLLSVASRDLEPVPLSEVRSSRDVQDSDRTIALEGESEMGSVLNQEHNEFVSSHETTNDMSFRSFFSNRASHTMQSPSLIIPANIPESSDLNEIRLSTETPTQRIFKQESIAEGSDVLEIIQLENMSNVSHYPPTPRVPLLEMKYNPMSRNEYVEHEIIPFTKHKKYLESIQDMILTLELPICESMMSRIERTIKNIGVFGNGDEKVTSEEIHAATLTCLFIVTKSAKESINEDSTSLRDFLLFLRNTVITARIPILDGLQHKLKILIAECSSRDKRIPMDKIHSALRTIIDVVAT